MVVATGAEKHATRPYHSTDEPACSQRYKCNRARNSSAEKNRYQIPEPAHEMSTAVWGSLKIKGGKQPHIQPAKPDRRQSRADKHKHQLEVAKMSTAVWGSLKINSGGKNSSPHVQPAPQNMRFSESLTAAMANRKAKYKDVSKELNNLITKEEEATVIASPPFNVDRLKLVMQKIIRQQFIIRDEDGDLLKWKYEPAKNLELSQKIAKTIKDKFRAYNFSRYRIVSICSIVEKDGQGISYKMKYIMDPFLDNYVQYVHDMAHFWIIATVLLVHKD